MRVGRTKATELVRQVLHLCSNVLWRDAFFFCNVSVVAAGKVGLKNVSLWRLTCNGLLGRYVASGPGLGSMRLHHKPRPIQQTVQKADPSLLQYAASVRDNFEKYFIQSSCSFHRAPDANDEAGCGVGLRREHETRQFVS